MMYLAVCGAAAFGALARHLTGLVATRLTGRSTLGTLLANVLGALLAGCIAGASLAWGLPSTWHVVVGTGFLGAYTTFSSWMVEAAAYLRDDEPIKMLLHVMGSTVLGTAAAALGLVTVVTLG
ncbi:MAG: CrcB family protein [Longimonas sp.]|uniref:fluoride efflux transporter FluC n=1 Tax=Longimonas sp. TaxID=2039626 RepID=UPI0033584AB3